MQTRLSASTCATGQARQGDATQVRGARAGVVGAHRVEVDQIVHGQPATREPLLDVVPVYEELSVGRGRDEAEVSCWRKSHHPPAHRPSPCGTEQRAASSREHVVVDDVVGWLDRALACLEPAKTSRVRSDLVLQQVQAPGTVEDKLALQLGDPGNP
jgi:hypothetical protein